MSNWFEVSASGLKKLQAGKPKYYIVRELIQNALDETITKCEVTAKHDPKFTTVKVEDDSPIGFRDISDAYTMFQDTYKRKNPEKRGRYTIGEKQAISLCEGSSKAFAEILTTKGGVRFDSVGRHRLRRKRENGTSVTIKYPGSKKDYQDMLDYIYTILIPDGVKFILNGERLNYIEPFKIFTAKLQTEVDKGDGLKRTKRKTRVDLHKISKSMLYEMGIPVCEIDCEYGIDVQQRVPLSIDRETVSQAFLQDLFAEVLNNTYEDIEEDKSSQVWIRQGMSDERIKKEAVETIIKKRFGDKVVVATPTDPTSVDDAIAGGYRVIQGRELSKEEWGNIKKFGEGGNGGLIPSSKEMFGKGIASYTHYLEPDKSMLRVADFVNRIALRWAGISVTVSFIESDATQLASYNDGVLTFNVSRLDKGIFKRLNGRLLELIIHELAHHYGMHTEKEYHSAMEKLGAEMVMIALNEPSFFKIGGVDK